MPPSDDWYDRPLGEPPLGTPEYYDYQRMVTRNQEDQAAEYRKSEELRIQSLRPAPDYAGPGLDGQSSQRVKRAGPPRKLGSRWFFLTVPLALIALTVSVGSNGHTVLFPLWQRVAFAVLISALGSPRLRRGAFALLILALVIAWLLGG